MIKHFKNGLYFPFFEIKLFNQFKIKQITRLIGNTIYVFLNLNLKQLYRQWNILIKYVYIYI